MCGLLPPSADGAERLEPSVVASVEVREELVELAELRAEQLRNHSTWSKSVAVCAHRWHFEALNGHVVGLNGHSTATQRPLNGHVVGLEMARHRTHLWKDEHVEDEPSLSSSKLLRSRGGVLPAAEDGVEVRVVDGSEVRITGLL